MDNKGRTGFAGMDIHIYADVGDFPKHLQCHIRSIPGSQFSSFHHPFLVNMLPLGLPDTIESVIQYRSKLAYAKLDAGSFAGYLFGHERPYRMRELTKLLLAGHFSDDAKSSIRFWRLASSIWMDAEEDESSEIWETLLQANMANRAAMTNSVDRRALAAMPDMLTIYRGLQATDERSALDDACTGYSWSLQEATAVFFARRHLRPEHTAWVASTEVQKASVLTYMTRRGEAETLVDSSLLDPEIIKLDQLLDSSRSSSDLISLRKFFAE
jgi:predicted Fe-S protein YdhL (DUF1289 family)